jgi:hypothetical protein
MAALTIAAGALCCAGGALSHFFDATKQREGSFSFYGFIFLLVGMYLSR